MSSYFANSYMPDLRNGGVVSAEHPHQQHHYGAAVVPQGAEDPSACDPRQGIAPHHYGGPPAAGQPPQGMPYPRFPPYDRMDIRAAGYYQNMDYRADSPNSMHMGTNGHQTPVVYASCKLQAAVGNGIGGPESPPDMEMTPHHHAHQQQHHMGPHQHQTAPPPPNQQSHMMYNSQAPPQATPHHPQQQAVQQPNVPPNAPPNQNNNNNNSNLPSPLYPWMRSQFGEYFL